MITYDKDDNEDIGNLMKMEVQYSSDEEIKQITKKKKLARDQLTKDQHQITKTIIEDFDIY